VTIKARRYLALLSLAPTVTVVISIGNRRNPGYRNQHRVGSGIHHACAEQTHTVEACVGTGTSMGTGSLGQVSELAGLAVGSLWRERGAE